MTSSATAVTYTLGINPDLYRPIAIGLLVTVGLVVTVSPVIYNTIERVEMVLVSVILIFLVFAIFIATKGSSWAGVITQAPSGAANFFQIAGEVGAATLLGAIAFAGAGGANNLVQSNYVRDKGLAMGANIPNIVSPITGEEEARPSLGYTFPMDEENLRRWRGWWKVANMEQGILFYGIGLLSLIALSVLANSTLGVRPGLPADLEFIREEAIVLGNTVAPWFATFFLGAAAIKLFSTNIGILDWVSRLTADSLKVSWLARSQFWSEQDLPHGRLEYDHHWDDHHPERHRAVDPPDHRRLGWRGRDGLLLDDAPRAKPPGAAGSHQAQELPPRDNSLFVRNVYRPLNLPALCGSHRADTVGRYRSCGSAAGVSWSIPAARTT